MSIKNLLTKTQDMNQVFYEVIWNKYLIEWRKERDKERAKSPHYHASSLVDKNFCIVRAVLEEMIKNTDEIFSPQTLSIFWNGVDVHKRHQKFYRESGISFYIEQVTYSKFLDMTGKSDAIINFMGSTTIIELKSMNSFLFDKLQAPPYNAYCQSLIYMYLHGIPQALVVVENKNFQTLKIYKIDFNINEALKLIKRRYIIIKCLKKNMIPLSKRICKKPKIKKRCKFNDICFDKEKLKNILRKNKSESIRD